MADLSVTAAQVMPSTGAHIHTAIAGGAITAGQVCYLDGQNPKLADADNTSVTATVKGIALNSCASGQYVTLQTGGTIIIGAGALVIEGEIYVLSGTPGGIAVEADLATADYVSYLGIGDGSDGIILNIHNSGVVVPAP